MANAICALSTGVLRKLLPSASPGAKAIACRMPSSAPQRSSQVGRDGGHLVGLVDVHLEHVGRRVAEPLGDPLRDPQPAAEAGQDDLGALLLRALGDGVGDRALGEDSGDE